MGASSAQVDYLLISWIYLILKNIETSKFHEKRQFVRCWARRAENRRGGGLKMWITRPFWGFSVKNEKKRLKKKCHLLNLWLNFGEYRFLCFPD